MLLPPLVRQESWLIPNTETLLFPPTESLPGTTLCSPFQTFHFHNTSVQPCSTWEEFHGYFESPSLSWSVCTAAAVRPRCLHSWQIQRDTFHLSSVDTKCPCWIWESHGILSPRLLFFRVQPTSPTASARWKEGSRCVTFPGQRGKTNSYSTFWWFHCPIPCSLYISATKSMMSGTICFWLPINSWPSILFYYGFVLLLHESFPSPTFKTLHWFYLSSTSHLSLQVW